MLLMRTLINQAKDEICGMKEYAMLAMDFKSTRPDLSASYYKMAASEQEHFNTLHAWIMKVKSEAEGSGEEIPPGMLDRYYQQHDRLVEDFAQAKALLEMAK